MPPLIQGLRAKSRHRRAVTRAATTGERARRFAQNDLLPHLTVSTIPIVDLVLLRRAVRKLDPEHVLEVRSAIEAFGFTVPVLVGRDGEVIDGAVRVAAAKELGLTAVPCVRMDHLRPEQQALLRLAVNRLGEKGEWDIDELKIVFDEFVLQNVPLEMSGFTADEVDQILLDDEDSEVQRGPLAPDPALSPIARPGDMFLLGNHRLICGDARDPDVLARLMGEDRARLLCTDPPYNVRIAGNVSSKDRREFVMASGELSDEEFGAFNRAWVESARPFLVDGALCAPFIDWRGQGTLCMAVTSCGLELINLIVWSKTNGGMGSLYRSAHELLPLFKHGRAPHRNNVQLGAKGRNRTNVWTCPGASSVGSDARRGLKDHPTVKPTAMLIDFLLDVTDRDEAILDPFLGSGSMLIAAERTGRRARGIELDPLYVDVAVRRWQSETGRAARCTRTGVEFDDLSENRFVEVPAIRLEVAPPILCLPAPKSSNP